MSSPQLQVVRPPRVDDPLSIKFMFEDLERSGLTPQDMGAYPLDSSRYGFTGAYCLPYAHNQFMWRTRHDRKVDKYLQPKGTRDVWIPPGMSLDDLRASNTLYIIEGEKKAARFNKQWPDLAVIGIGGAWNYMSQAEDGTKKLLPTLIETLRPGKVVIAIFDGDILTKPGVQMAATSLRNLLRPLSCTLEIAYPPVAKGLDDWLQGAPDAALEEVKYLAYDKLEESRKQLFAVTGCQMHEDKLILNELNASKLLTHHFGESLFEDKRLGLIVNGSPMSFDDFYTEAAVYMQQHISAHYKVGAINTGASFAIRNRRRDLVQEYILDQQWDGVPRLATWANEYFESEWPEWTAEWGRVLMTSLALRILEPGTKADKVCILAGPQGIGKSTFFEQLSEFGGHRFYFACTKLMASAGDANRTQGMMFSRSTIVDLAEGVVFETRKHELDMVKQVLTQTEDEYRLPYSKSAKIEPRGFIFVGTTNRYDQLSDATGSRRYMYLKTSKITALPHPVKMQILAEVVANEYAIRGSRWWEEQVDMNTCPWKANLDDADAPIYDTPQAAMNSRFTKHDAREEFITNLVSSDHLLVHRDSGLPYITATYTAVLAQEDGNFQSKNMWGRKLSELAASPSFPYKLTLQRYRMQQMLGPESVKQAYMQGITNNQAMLVGYTVERKQRV